MKWTISVCTMPASKVLCLIVYIIDLKQWSNRSGRLSYHPILTAANHWIRWTQENPHYLRWRDRNGDVQLRVLGCIAVCFSLSILNGKKSHLVQRLFENMNPEYKFCKLKSKDDYIEVLIEFSSGDKLRVACSSVRFGEAENDEWNI